MSGRRLLEKTAALIREIKELLPKDKRLMRDIFAEDGWDEGCENAIRLGNE